ncbi:MAG: endospore germination permease [Alicyclobacillus sp.]|nr:endospore germination permease [Alicyclobacillus sp.]
MAEERIHTRQFALMSIPMIIATEFMIAPSASAAYAKQHAWVSVFAGSATALWTVWVLTALAKRYPGQSIAQYSQVILGKWGGRLVCLLIAYHLLMWTGTIADEIMSFVTLFAQPRTPRLVTMGLFVVLCTAAVWVGIEAIGRCADVVVPLNIIFVLLVSVLMIPDMNQEYLKPWFGDGVRGLLQGMVVPSGWASEYFLIGFLIPFVNEPQKVRKAALVSVGVVVFFMTMLTIESLMVNGPLTAKLAYSYYSAARDVSIADFIERLDPVMISVWVFGGFLKESVFLFCLCLCVSQMCGLSSYRTVVLPLALLTVVTGFWLFPNAFEMRRFLVYTFPVAAFVLHNLLPTVLLAVDMVRPKPKTAAKAGKAA